MTKALQRSIKPLKIKRLDYNRYLIHSSFDGNKILPTPTGYYEHSEFGNSKEPSFNFQLADETYIPGTRRKHGEFVAVIDSCVII